MNRCVLLVLLWAFSATTAEVVDIPLVGKVKGTTSTTLWSGRTVYEYRSIPYAQPPVGDLRFREPVKAEPWSDEKDCTEFGQRCPQPDQSNLAALSAMMTPSAAATYQQSKSAVLKAFSEDCLTLDVYTPTTDSNAKLPVLVYIHPGFFVWGTSASIRPGYLLEHDVILVAMQYRLGPLGFLYLNHEEVPGNMGLMDQKLALEWVRDNIAAFGGDPDKITLGGSSAGAASTSLLALNDEAKDLFRSTIVQSGSALGIWAVDVQISDDENENTKDSKEIAKLAGCDEETPEAIATCLRSINETDIVNAYLQFSNEERLNGRLGTGGAMPVVQQKDKPYTAIITENPLDILRNGSLFDHKPMLAGICKHEGIFALDLIYESFLLPGGLIEDSDFLKEHLVESILSLYNIKEVSRTFVDAVQRRYLPNEYLGSFEKMKYGLIDLVGAEFLKSPWYKQADLLSVPSDSSVYMYAWDYYGKYSLMDSKNRTNLVPLNGGITHSDDTIFMFDNEKYPLDEYEKKVSQRFVDAIANFVTNGDPNNPAREVNALPEWKKFDRENAYYMKMYDEASLDMDYRDKYTAARMDGIRDRNLAAASIASPLLILSAALYHLLN